MSEHFIGDEKVRVEFPDGQWVDIKEELSQRDQDHLLNVMAGVKGDDKPSIAFNIGKLAILEKCVIAWSFPEPINTETLCNLRRKYRLPVLEKIDELNSQPYQYVAKN